MSGQPEPPQPVPVGSVGGPLAAVLVVGLLALTVGVAILGKGPSGPVAPTVPASSLAAITTSAPPASPLPLVTFVPPSNVVLPTWEPPAGAVTRLPLAADADLDYFAAEGNHVYYAAHESTVVHMVDVVRRTDQIIATLPEGHSVYSISAAAGRVAWVEWWVTAPGFTGGPCSVHDIIPRHWRIWLSEASHPVPRVIASGVAQEMWTTPGGCIGPLPPLVALSSDAFAYDIERGNQSVIEVHALVGGALQWSGHAASSLVLDLQLAPGVVGSVSTDIGSSLAGDYVLVTRFGGSSSAMVGGPGDTGGPGDALSLAADGSVALFTSPNPAAGLPGSLQSPSVLWRLPLLWPTNGAPPGPEPLAPAPNAPAGESAEAPAVGTWHGLATILWRDVAPEGTAHAAISLNGYQHLILGLPAPGWTAISGQWAIWTDVRGTVPILYVLNLSDVPFGAGR